jgi:hypothetical protein
MSPRFGRDLVPFGPVWTPATKSQSPDGEGFLTHLVDLVVMCRGGIAARERGRARACTSVPPSDALGQINQIGVRPVAVPRFRFGNGRPKPTNRGPNADQIGGGVA